ncbi:tyrosine-type recombinase/integrase [Actinomyces faecalis]|uniref:tyrosine-type recombinase/integrase n=1 Tax=Actinomyces faecalis TaxID=2722820 RepID=UPI001557082A|nr:tyrosine-type recombinase/integrase [Actinomyces faecalis]
MWPRPSGAPYSKSDDRAAFRGLQDAAGVHKGGRGTLDSPWVYYVVHEARHSTATLLMALDVPAPVIVSIMGHSSIASTRRYQHADVDQARRALEGVAGLLRIEG